MPTNSDLTLDQIEQIFREMGLSTAEERARMIRLYSGWPPSVREPATTLETTTEALDKKPDAELE
jgi:hypothetical protein